MRLLVVVMAAASTVVSASDKVPLTWTDRRTYTLEIKINDRNYTMQLGTLSSDVWLQCRSYVDSCSKTMCASVLAVESGHVCTTQSTASLEWSAVSVNESNFVISTQQLAVPGKDFPGLLSSAYLPAKDMVSNLPLVTSAAGVLGLGRGGSIAKSPKLLIEDFSLYLRGEAEKDASFLMVKGVDNEFLSSKGYKTRASIPVWAPSSSEFNAVNKSISWPVEIKAFAVGDKGPTTPHSKSSSQSSVGILSANSRGIEVPRAVANYFATHFLSVDVCAYVDNLEDPSYLSCPKDSVKDLPRLAIYIHDSVFYLEQEDYTHTDPSDDSRVVIDITEGVVSDENVWVLGAPFLRRFPSYFQSIAGAVTLYCVADSSCKAQATITNIASLEDAASTTQSDSTSESISPTETKSKSSFSMVAIGFAVAVGVGVVLVMAVFYMIKRRRKQQSQSQEAAVQDFYNRLRQNEVETMASERDLASQLGPRAQAQLPPVPEVADVAEMVTPPTSYRRQ
ncbi:hypothetical protein Poli38472_012279 [Pythium oligandrum]|uniref:Peptidase A1 domain-containing protein n=1 Tax=Pythium oligandrum TaxID=41045 RepID=A0A8K1CRU0_PYTOL|nr:hypothetical protein Poli38472_012279 [Pythium oligandrum]|eukprot:TMW67163.1 hypothetical protein Poli38472_012279 [Pythium oligandrum]